MERGFVCTGGLARNAATIEEVDARAEPYTHESGQLTGSQSDPPRHQFVPLLAAAQRVRMGIPRKR
jgi:hypothetical protein